MTSLARFSLLGFGTLWFAACATPPPPLGQNQARLTVQDYGVEVASGNAPRDGEFRHSLVVPAGPQRVTARFVIADSNGAIIALISAHQSAKTVAEIPFRARAGHEYRLEYTRGHGLRNTSYQIKDAATGQLAGEGRPAPVLD